MIDFGCKDRESYYVGVGNFLLLRIDLMSQNVISCRIWSQIVSLKNNWMSQLQPPLQK